MRKAPSSSACPAPPRRRAVSISHCRWMRFRPRYYPGLHRRCSVREREDKQFENLLYYLQQNRGFDFTGYKRPSLMRRVSKRMQMVNVDSFVDYLDYLEVHPEEFSQLFNTILINVTSFFRDPVAWGYLGEEIIPRLLQEKAPADPIRVWSAGCASGEEAYT